MKKILFFLCLCGRITDVRVYLVVAFFVACFTSLSLGAKTLEEMVLELGADEVEVREQAEKDVWQQGDAILPILRLAAESDDPEMQQRANKLLFVIETGLELNADSVLTQRLLDLKNLTTLEEKNNFAAAWILSLDINKELVAAELLPMLRCFSKYKIDNKEVISRMHFHHFRASTKALQEGKMDMLLSLNNPEFGPIIYHAPYSFGVLSEHFMENSADFLKALNPEKRAWYAVAAKDEAFLSQLADDNPAKMYYQVNTGQDAGFDVHIYDQMHGNLSDMRKKDFISVVECLKARRQGGLKQSSEKDAQVCSILKDPVVYALLGMDEKLSQFVKDQKKGEWLWKYPSFFKSLSYHPEVDGVGLDLTNEQLLQRGKTLVTEITEMLGEMPLKKDRDLLREKIEGLISALREIEGRLGIVGIKQLSDYLAQELLQKEKCDTEERVEPAAMVGTYQIYFYLSSYLIALQQNDMMIQLLDSYFILGGEKAQLYANQFARELCGASLLFSHPVDWKKLMTQIDPKANEWECFHLAFRLFGMAYDDQKNEDALKRLEEIVAKEPKDEQLARATAFVVAGRFFMTSDYLPCLGELLEKMNAWQYVEGICSDFACYSLGLYLVERYTVTHDSNDLKYAETLWHVVEDKKEKSLFLYLFQSNFLAVLGKLEESKKAQKMVDAYEVLGRGTHYVGYFYQFFKAQDAILYEKKDIDCRMGYVFQLMEKGEYLKAQREIDSTFLNLLVTSHIQVSIDLIEIMRAYSDVAQALLWHRTGKTADAVAQLEVVFKRVKNMPVNLSIGFLRFVCAEKGLPQEQVKSWVLESKELLRKEAASYPFNVFYQTSIAFFAVATGDEIEEGRRMLLTALKKKHKLGVRIDLMSTLARLEEKAGNLELAKKYMKECMLMWPFGVNKDIYLRISDRLNEARE